MDASSDQQRILVPGRKLVITNIHRGHGARSSLVYAELRDEETNEMLICSTLDFITQRLEVDAQFFA